MNRRTAVRTGLMTVALATLAACVVNLAFDMKKQVVIQTQAGATNYSQNVLVDLGQYKEITDHKKDIKSLDLDSLDATVSATGVNNHATKVSGTIVLRKVLTDATADVQVGTFTNLSTAQGSTVHIAGSPALDAFLLSQLQQAGTFYVVITNGQLDGQADLTLDVTIHASMGYDTGIL